MSIYLIHGPHAYEIILTDEISVASIIRYRHMRNSGGEFVEYDSLPDGLQATISNKLTSLIDNIENEDRPESTTEG